MPLKKMLWNVVLFFLIAALLLRLQCFKKDFVSAADRPGEGLWMERSCHHTTSQPLCGPPGVLQHLHLQAAVRNLLCPRGRLWPRGQAPTGSHRRGRSIQVFFSKSILQLPQGQKRCAGQARTPLLPSEEHRELAPGVVLLLGSLLVPVKPPQPCHGHQ